MERFKAAGTRARCFVRREGEKPFIHIAVGCIQNIQGEVLICQRPSHKIYPGEWEFPGGKVEAGESAEEALKRELHEELGIRVGGCRPLIRVRHVYPELAVDLDTWRVSDYDGVIALSEHPDLAWVLPEELPRWKLLAGNRPIVSALRLPGHYVFTPVEADSAWLRERLDRLPEGGLLRLRMPGLSAAAYETLAKQLLPLSRGRKLALILDRDPTMAQRLGAGGWHASAAQLQTLRGRPVLESLWFGASCHSSQEVQLARELGADFVVIGPILNTATHPDHTRLGWTALRELVSAAGIPAYAIGGLKQEQLAEVRAQGALGVAGIRTYWDATAA